ncbi:hypothetical protein BN2537_2675 [Streptomyces venezuelae]|nr:hypothetical protein BN2537_2675 [Streptomyces venezuelae]
MCCPVTPPSTARSGAARAEWSTLRPERARLCRSANLPRPGGTFGPVIGPSGPPATRDQLPGWKESPGPREEERWREPQSVPASAGSSSASTDHHPHARR